MTNLDVLHSELLPGMEGVLAPNEEFVGVLKEITVDTASVETSDGIQSFPLNELFLRKTKFNISSYLSFAATPEKSEEILKIIEGRKAEIYNAKKLYQEINKIARSLFTFKDNDGSTQQVLFQNRDGFCFTVAVRAKFLSKNCETKCCFFPIGVAESTTKAFHHFHQLMISILVPLIQ